MECFFDWSLFNSVIGTYQRECQANSVVIEENMTNDSLYRLVHGTVRFESTKKYGNFPSPRFRFGSISSTDRWPIFCEMSALKPEGDGKKKISCVVVADTLCQVQVIPMSVFWSVILSRIQDACLFFESMCRHYALKLSEIHMRAVERVDLKGLVQCLHINSEPSIYSWRCFRSPMKVNPGFLFFHLLSFSFFSSSHFLFVKKRVIVCVEIFSCFR